MPPKKPVKVSESRDLVPVGPRHVSAKTRVSRRNEDGLLPTTARAIVLRNGKHGAMGTGELMSTRKVSGREKLDLLGEDLIAKSKTALGTPFRLQQCLNIADSQFNVYLDSILELQDHETFYNAFSREIYSRMSSTTTTKGQADPLKNRPLVMTALGTRIHNSYMLTSAWRFIRDGLETLDQEGIADDRVRVQLRDDPDLRTQYLILYDIVNVLVDALQANFSVLATKTAHFSQYFKTVEGSDPDDPDIAFDWASLKTSYKSFVDSIVIELCLPHSQFPKYILTSILEDAVDEAPGESKRFPQALWDALGDLSVAVKLQEILEAPLLGPDGEKWRKLPRESPEEFIRWVEAQSSSDEASKTFEANGLDIIFPLENTKKRNVLDMMWRRINAAYEKSTGANLETLWQLGNETKRVPYWGTRNPPNINDDAKGLVPYKATKETGKKGQKRLAITNDAASDGGSMPSLETVSDSSEGDEDGPVHPGSDEWETDDEDDGDDEYGDSDYDTEEEEEMKIYARMAMDTAYSHPDFMDQRNPTNDKMLAEERKDNPFLKLLGSLRGRMFSANPKLKTTGRGEPRQPSGTLPTYRPAPPATDAASKSRNVTVEEVEDEDAPTEAAKKKKKKPKKKKKKPTAATDPGRASPQPDAAPVALAPSETLPAPAQTQAPVTPATPSAKTKPTPPKSPPPKSPPRKSPPLTSRSTLGSGSTATLANMSTASLDITRQQTAQSAHSYLQSEHIKDQKTKIKSRPEHGNLQSITEKKGFLSRFGKKKDNVSPEEKEREKQSMSKWFGNLTKKASEGMHQILHTQGKQSVKPMKWDHFVKIMKEMGFSYDPSTAGSSVRFDPPGGEARSISFHKPHPDSTIDPITLTLWGKKLKDYYGWSEEIFLHHAGA
ncbi:hypothetical protein BV25DRAFT_1855093 [Artomyces pyxidatus]|uniref:Uncharacterized protein n=1 Tax=Artomyces pyxidatus TaxID=48021 RepID=A0ACB8T3R9_9AGAM|nr:hypothetical protein BV25DRAFT_1855093 [Artomyces pyxidatus]